MLISVYITASQYWRRSVLAAAGPQSRGRMHRRPLALAPSPTPCSFTGLSRHTHSRTHIRGLVLTVSPHSVTRRSAGCRAAPDFKDPLLFIWLLEARSFPLTRLGCLGCPTGHTWAIPLMSALHRWPQQSTLPPPNSPLFFHSHQNSLSRKDLKLRHTQEQPLMTVDKISCRTGHQSWGAVGCIARLAIPVKHAYHLKSFLRLTRSLCVITLSGPSLPAPSPGSSAT